MCVGVSVCVCARVCVCVFFFFFWFFGFFFFWGGVVIMSNQLVAFDARVVSVFSGSFSLCTCLHIYVVILKK